MLLQNSKANELVDLEGGFFRCRATGQQNAKLDVDVKSICSQIGTRNQQSTPVGNCELGMKGAMAPPRVADVRSIFVTGRGSSLATAGTGGLILKESTRQPAEGMSCPAFRHGPIEMIGEHVLVLVLAGEARVASLHRRLAEDIRRGGGKVALIEAGETVPDVFRLPPVPEALLPLVEILPVQMLSLALAARDGREAGRFERATKITTAD